MRPSRLRSVLLQPRGLALAPVRGLAVALTVALTACGGGGGSSTPPPTPTPSACTAGSVATVADASVAAGKTAGAAITGCSAPVNAVQWTQTSGPAVVLLADKTQAISFDAPAQGTYGFNVSYRDAAGAAQSRSVSVTATAAVSGSSITVRGDQAVRKAAQTSLRAWPTLAAGDSVATNGITWAQLEGPTVSLDLSDPRRPIFTAPDVSTDTVLRFRATLQTAQGARDSDDVIVVVENYAQAPANNNAYPFSGLTVSRVYPYKSTSPFANDLVRCTYNAQLQYTNATNNNLCTLGTLPFLHQSTNGAVPTTAQIMDRVIVSHDWMGKNFEDFLNSASASDDLKRMFNGVTAIVIGAQVRPSFYYALTGAIYLDANNFWLTPAQRDVISEVPDFRSNFDRDLQYSGLWRYALNNQSIFVAFPASSRTPRTLDYLLNEAGWLMYHELGHASDFLPPAVRGSLNNGLSAWDNIAPRFSSRQLPSDLLSTQLPLTSSEMRALAQVKFQTGPKPGESINGIPYSTLTTFTPQQAAGFFSGDRATDEYNYSTTREDIAMVIEEFLMQRNHQFRRDVAITDKITPTSTSSTLIVRWGQRGRIGEASVKPRAQLVVEQLTPWVLQQNANAVNIIPAPIPMRPGESWAANVALPAPLGGQVGGLSVRGRGMTAEEDRMLLDRALSGAHGGSAVSDGAYRPFGHWTPNDRWLEQLRRQ